MAKRHPPPAWLSWRRMLDGLPFGRQWSAEEREARAEERNEQERAGGWGSGVASLFTG